MAGHNELGVESFSSDSLVNFAKEYSVFKRTTHFWLADNPRLVINPLRMRSRVTVVCLCVCLSVCMSVTVLTARVLILAVQAWY